MSEQLRIFMERLPACRRGAAAAATSAAMTLKLVLPFEQRQKARQRARIAGGFEVGIQLPRRGTVLRGGDQLRAADGTVLQILAAREPVSTVSEPRPAAPRAGGVPLGQPPRRPRNRHGLGAIPRRPRLGRHGCPARPDGIHHDEPFEPEAGRVQPSRARAWRRAVAPPPSARARTRSRPRPAARAPVIFGGVHRHPHDHEQ